jgi:hypothetical protein
MAAVVMRMQPWLASQGRQRRGHQRAVPAYVVDTADRARGWLLAASLPCVLGHADFEAQNLRRHGQQVWAVHDWDSLAWQPEAALAGAASGAFASAGPPTLAPSGWQRTTSGRHCTATPRCPAMRSAHKQPNASAERMPSTSMRVRRTPTPHHCLGKRAVRNKATAQAAAINEWL